MPLSPLLESYDNVLLDLDGCVWLGEEATPGAVQAISELRTAGKRLSFLTNDARRAPEDYVRKLWGLGIQASLEEVVTAGAALQYALAERPPGGAYVIGSEAVFRHVADAGQRILNGQARSTQADVLVVAGHDDFDYRELREGIQALLAGAEMIAANRDRTFPTQDGPWPGSGAIVAALEYASGRAARIVGKPAAHIFRTALDRLDRGRTLMVGDRLDSDVEGARAAGLDAAIVLTGVTSRQEAEEFAAQAGAGASHEAEHLAAQAGAGAGRQSADEGGASRDRESVSAHSPPVAIAEDLHSLVVGHGR
jgi:glycerol-1-phosphatase